MRNSGCIITWTLHAVQVLYQNMEFGFDAELDDQQERVDLSKLDGCNPAGPAHLLHWVLRQLPTATGYFSTALTGMLAHSRLKSAAVMEVLHVADRVQSVCG